MSKISSYSNKATPVDADKLLGSDSESSNATSNFLLSAIKTLFHTAASFVNGVTVSGDLTVDTDTLKVDSTNNRVGIGTASPAAPLSVDSSSSTLFDITRSTASDQNTVLRLNNNSGTVNFGSDDTGGYALKFDSADLSTSPALKIDRSGNVGIGTTSPDQLLHVENSAGLASIQITSNAANNASLLFGDTADVDRGRIQYVNADDSMRLTVNAAEAMRIDSSGNVLVGKTTSNITVDGVQIQGDGLVASTRASNYALLVNRETDDGELVQFRQDNTQHGSISIAGSTTSYNTSSDYRLKENVEPLTGATERILNLKPSRFNFKTTPDKVVDGFLAHEVQDVIPEAVQGVKDGMKDEEFVSSPALGEIFIPGIEAVEASEGVEAVEAVAEVILQSDVEQPTEELEEGVWRETTPEVIETKQVEDYQGIDQSKIVPLLVATIQELEARIKTLESN